ncbi:hypothetical protein OUZ56_008430 [Daphnia magna]|uniref:Uncharacterized protein n=1 Tax=Daphnia magna TaxID=35525 RepID=A0ABR0AD61_9CRUS|nr:hypothetical protein OUZ56_008430 [Daphnia magna]
MANLRFPCALAFMIVFVVCVQNADGYKECQRKSIFFGVKSSFACPEPGQTPDMMFCCGDDNDFGGEFCCRGSIIDRIGSINATVAGVIGFLIILFVICCCICSCCILYKRRTAGTVYRSIAIPNSTVPSSVNVTVVHAPGAGMARGPPPVGFTAQPGGNQGTGYPVQPNYAPQPGYPVQPNYPPQPGYPPYPQNAGPANQTKSGYP